jgi:HEPN superfamily AbiU2-like protein
MRRLSLLMKRPEATTSNQISMELPKYTEDFGGVDDQKLARELLNVTREMRVLLGQFFLYTAMTRSRDFADACNKSRAKEGSGIVVASLMRSMVVSSAAMFGKDSREMSLPKILKAAIKHDRRSFIRGLHAHHGTEREAEVSFQRLTKYRKAIKRGKLHEAIIALTDARNASIAHFDTEPRATGRTAIVHDIDRVVAASSVIVGEANVFILNRRPDTAALRKILRNEANGFVRTLENGF